MRWEAAGGRRHIRDSEAVFCHLDLSLNFLVNNDKTPGLGKETVGLFSPSWEAREARAALSAVSSVSVCTSRCQR